MRAIAPNRSHLPLLSAKTGLGIMQDETLNLHREDYSLLTDLYQLTMAACYVGEG
ncbi:MAG: hypothetical protein HC832_04875, partial [Leptolyngbyaceae cyanobacterium RM1_405_57]|nr:hypothetical protein [Leptolyngbyaceae cyanobacterium RM1_405_57]